MSECKPWWDEVIDDFNYKTDPRLLTMARDVRQHIHTLKAERDEAISRMQTAREHLVFVLDAPTAEEAHKIAQRGYELTVGPQLPVTEAMVRKAEQGGAGS